MIIDVYEGERPMFADNYNLGKFWLEGLTLKPAGGLKITVTFDIDVSGLMHVTATETQSNITKSILIKYDNNRLQGD
jgi:molecular chaperone DnaK (HSP70)